MDPEPNWNETGLDVESMFKPEAMSFWLQYPPQLLTQALVHEIREVIMKVELQLGFIKPAPGSPVDYSGTVSPDEVCDAIRRHQATLKDITDILWAYSKVKMPNKSA
ncbi:MAG: hypothetical protein K8I60_12610 [Anaerolineae bacterium]|nr:hypothetical protein [Anaerolineae bacterium]